MYIYILELHNILEMVVAEKCSKEDNPPPGYTLSSLNVYHVLYLRPCFVHRQCLLNSIQENVFMAGI